MTIDPRPRSLMDKLIWFCLNNKLVVFLLLLFTVVWGILVAPFDWKVYDLPRDPVPVDAIPDIGENQQIVFTQWMGRSPQDIEDQITYPLTTSLLGIPGVKTVRSYSFFGFSTIYVIFKEEIDFYWSRSRILEKLNSLPAGTLPSGVQPSLGPDATALGQIFWYTLEGRDPEGNPTGGWDLHELRTTQDWYVRYALLSAEGVSEVASVGGHVQEYQIDVDPDAMRAHDVTIEQVFHAVRMSNQDVGARNIEINRVEYFIRGLGFIDELDDIRFAVVKTNDDVPIYVKDVATVNLGPAQRRGVLDKGGAEAVGGVVVVRYGDNPLEVIQNVKAKIREITPGLPQKTLADGTVSKVEIVPFYDRSTLIFETLGTLNTALSHEILVTVIVILIMLMNLRSSVLVSGLLPLAVLMTFIAMKEFHVDANIVALSGIAIAIGTMVDMGIVIVENIINRLEEADPETPAVVTVFRASSEVGGAVLTAVATTVISFLPVFTMEAAEGKLFRPLAFTKTFALIASILVSLVLIPPIAHMLFGRRTGSDRPRRNLPLSRGRLKMPRPSETFHAFLIVAGLVLGPLWSWWLTPLLLGWGAYGLWGHLLPDSVRTRIPMTVNVLAAILVAALLTEEWYPLGPGKGFTRNFLFVALMIAGILLFFRMLQWLYPHLLGWAMRHRLLFMTAPVSLLVLGATIWFGFDALFGWLPAKLKTNKAISTVAHAFPGLGKEFMPPLDEGSYLYMPTTSVHAAINEATDVMQKQNIGFYQIPEVDSAVGKLGRAETPLDPAPISMIETVINYKPEFLIDKSGKRLTFAFEAGERDFFRDAAGTPVAAPDGEPYEVRGRYARDESGDLIPDPHGVPFRLWRPALEPDLNPNREAWPGIRNPDDIWDEIVRMGLIPGSTSAPKLQPIAARIVMLQSGMRAPMGIKVKGPDLETIESVGLQIEKYLKEVPSVQTHAVIADRIIGKPYLEFNLDRRAMARYGVKLEQVQKVIELAIGGRTITTTVEGRERYPVRVRYQRELRDTLGKLQRVLVPTPGGAQVPIAQLSDLAYVSGPQVIKSEDTFLVSYVIFDKRDGYAEVDVVEQAKAYLDGKIASGELIIPPGVSYEFAGSYENQIRATKRLALVLPLALFLIFMILYLQFRSIATTTLIFSSILVAWAGGFLMIWMYGQSWFLDGHLFGINLRDLLAIEPINLSVAVWVGFLALFGIASDDGVLISTYLDQSFAEAKPDSVTAIREATMIAGQRRVRPALMTTATTIIALIPILTSTGRGSDIMKPMAIPTFGGMVVALITIFVVPVLYSLIAEIKLKHAHAPAGERAQTKN
ncbi:efflux RND transporter permease subunit [Sulfidibacter corallicola]|uniref:Efflux RND transporter permease subunit n=1 Tax=Sulfidibacter corallicola TaxID=2818388 RepID=A0A8A4TK77_SULCO|nr:efflux RND transporter permease subunit [Sulfidibacter corallicola]QTD49604.1 efflux RND transporter permease subunit [Sulfidibacter corallicola]